jgi:hypothetical protein
LAYDVARNAERIPWLGEELKSATTRLAALRWARRTRRAAATIAAHVPRGERVALIDDNSLDRGVFSSFEAVALSEDEGAPPDGPSAVAALQEAKQGGVRYVAICWPSFWWLDYYRELSEYLETQSSIVARGDDVALYAL